MIEHVDDFGHVWSGPFVSLEAAVGYAVQVDAVFYSPVAVWVEDLTHLKAILLRQVLDVGRLQQKSRGETTMNTLNNSSLHCIIHFLRYEKNSTIFLTFSILATTL